MKGITTKFLLILSIVLTLSVNAYAEKKVSIFIEGDLSNLQEQIVYGAFMNRVVSNKNYAVFERNEIFIKSITREHDYQTSGDVPEAQIRKIAQKYGVDYVVSVSVVMEESGIFMNARLINIETGKVEKSISQDRTTSNNTTLKNLSNNVAFRLLGGK